MNDRNLVIVGIMMALVLGLGLHIMFKMVSLPIDKMIGSSESGIHIPVDGSLNASVPSR